MKKIYEKVTIKQIHIVLQIVFWLSLVPVLWLAIYNYPCADDFTASDTVRAAWLSTGSLWNAFLAVLENVKHNYLNWSGVFASVFWTTLQPSVFGEQYYGIVTFITIALLILGGGYLSHVIFGKYLNVRKDLADCVTLLYLFMTIQYMPDGNEGLYWHAGVVNYTWAFAFLLILTGLELSLWKETNAKKRIGKVVAGVVMAICVGGGNYITALQGCIWLFLIFIFLCWKEKRAGKKVIEILKKRGPELLLLLMVVIAFATSVLAPGNAVRIAGSTGLGPVKAVLVSFVYCLEVPFTQWLKWNFYLTLAIAVPFLWRILKYVDYGFEYPGIVMLLGYGVASASYTPNLYAQANMLAGRLHDTAYFIFVLIIFVELFYILGWFQNKFIRKEVKNNKSISDSETIYLIGMCIFLFGATLLYGAVNKDVNIAYSATQSLVSGQAKIYKVENEKRLQILHDENIKDAVLESFSNPPDLLFFEDITSNPGEWINDTMAVYYGKESVRRE